MHQKSTAGRPISLLAALATMGLEATVLVVSGDHDAAALVVWEADAGREWLGTGLRLETWSLRFGLMMLAH